MSASAPRTLAGAVPSRMALLVILMVAVALMVVQAYVINHLAGIDYPRWSPRPPT